MNTRTLEAIRPRDASSDGIASSIERMKAVLIELKGEHAALQGARRGLLLTGTNADADKHDARLRSLGVDIERTEAVIEALVPDLSVARGRERLQQIQVLRIDAEKATESFREFWSERYEALARQIAAGIASERAAHHAVRVLKHAVAEADRDPDVQAAGGLPRLEMPAMPVGYVGQSWKSRAFLVCLPGVEPGPPIAWPSGHSLTPVKISPYAA